MIKRVLTTASIILVASLSSLCLADNNLFAPTAILVPANHADFTGYYNLGSNFWNSGSARIGLPAGFEVSFGSSRSLNGTGRQNLDFEYQYLAPIPDTSPGVAFGVTDSLNKTSAGRRYYAVLTEQIDMQANLSHALLANVSIGVTGGKFIAPTVAVKIPLGTNFDLLGEHDGFSINGGIEYEVNKSLAIYYIARGTSKFLKVRYRVRF